MGIRALDQWKVVHGHHCNTKAPMRYTRKVLLKSSPYPHQAGICFFIKPYMTNAIFKNKNLMMFSDHI